MKHTLFTAMYIEPRCIIKTDVTEVPVAEGYEPICYKRAFTWRYVTNVELRRLLPVKHSIWLQANCYATKNASYCYVRILSWLAKSPF